MFNVTIINTKKSLVRIFALLLMMIIIFGIVKIVTRFQTNEILKIDISEKLTECLGAEIPAIQSTYYKANNILKEDVEEKEENFAQRILKIELAKLEDVKETVSIANENSSENEEKN